MTIHKYILGVADIITLNVPTGATPLHVGEQNGEIYLWMLVDPDAKDRVMIFRCFGTGWEIRDDGFALKHVGSVVVGSFVWHYFRELVGD